MGKVLQFVYGLESGGIEAFVTNLNGCREIFDEPFDFLLYNSSDHVEFYEKINKDLGSNIYKFGDNCFSNFVIRCIQKRIRAYQFMKTHHYDVVHIHNSSVFCILEAIAAKAAGIPKVIVHSHNTVMGGTAGIKFVKNIIQIIGKSFWRFFADEYCACSTEAGIWMFGEKAVKKGKVHILKNGIRGDLFYFDDNVRREYRKKLGWEDNYIIGHVGRFNKQKNHTFLMDIFAEVYRLEPKARLLMFGVGELQNEIKKKAEKLGLLKYVNFYGTSNEINCWLQAMDLYLFPSLYEGLPVSGIEAQASGVPLLSSDTISPEMEVTNCVSWMSIEESAAHWAEKAVSLLKTIPIERNQRKAIQNAGYDIKETAGILKEMYRIEK
ncbi:MULTISPECIES: glycosyltransferase [Lachnospiraceae]|jgi:glycosyltransferase involved in cell wall biosynthesis|nr:MULTISPECIES: glycosyltransferase [Lachnospiraceae]MDB2128411.1 glycosyltransferase [Enterocloster clostridioformis]MDU1962357.1 glycosyltransferase [Enterocloster clostridioformis]